MSETIRSTFHLSGLGKAQLEKASNNLSSSNVATLKNIPTKCLKVTSDICRAVTKLNL